MTEYEYSFKVNSLEKVEKYCNDKNYEFLEKTSQIRTLYRNDNGTMARITIKKKEGSTKKMLDFKDDILSDEVLIERKESLPLLYEDDCALDSILDYLKYRKDKVLNRERTVYKKKGVIFELDKYKSPEVACVVAIEGEKKEVDYVYQEIKSLLML